MPPKKTRGNRGGDPYRYNQRRRREQALPAQEVVDRRPPKPDHPPPSAERPRSPQWKFIRSRALTPRSQVATSSVAAPSARSSVVSLPLPPGQDANQGVVGLRGPISERLAQCLLVVRLFRTQMSPCSADGRGHGRMGAGLSPT